MSKKVDYKIDNKEPCYTKLVLKNGDYVKVDIFELLENSIENNVKDVDKKEGLLSSLNYIHEEI